MEGTGVGVLLLGCVGGQGIVKCGSQGSSRACMEGKRKEIVEMRNFKRVMRNSF